MPLKFKKNSFKIMQLSDVHYIDGSKKDQETLRVMRQLIASEEPDFIVLNGDTVYCEDNDKRIPEALEPVTSSGIPWSLTFGNHDAEGGKSKDVLFDAIKDLANCLMQNNTPELYGVGNHELCIRDSDGQLQWVLFFMDSGDYLDHDIGGYDMVKLDQILWLKNRIQALETENPDFSALLFIHIPLPEHNEAFATEDVVGQKNEAICSSKLNSGLFASLVENGHIRGVYCGHDHLNDFTAKLHGIELGYGRASGFNTYGRDDFPRGARLFTLTSDPNIPFETWITLDPQA